MIISDILPAFLSEIGVLKGHTIENQLYAKIKPIDFDEENPDSFDPAFQLSPSVLIRSDTSRNIGKTDNLS